MGEGISITIADLGNNLYKLTVYDLNQHTKIEVQLNPGSAMSIAYEIESVVRGTYKSVDLRHNQIIRN